MAVSTDPNDPNFGLETDPSSPDFGLAPEPKEPPPAPLTNVAAMKSGVAEMSPEARAAAAEVVKAVPQAIEGAQTGAMAVATGGGSLITEALTPQPVKDFMRTPLVSPESVDVARQAAQYPIPTLSNILFGTDYKEQGPLASIGKFASDQIAGQITPENIALVAGTEGLGAANKILARKAPTVAEALFGSRIGKIPEENLQIKELTKATESEVIPNAKQVTETAQPDVNVQPAGGAQESQTVGSEVPATESGTGVPARGQGEKVQQVVDPISAAAYKLPDGKVYTGRIHLEALRAAEDELGRTLNPSELQSGFVTKGGKFMNNAEAMRYATETKQINKAEYDLQGEGVEGYISPSNLEAARFNAVKREPAAPVPQPEQPTLVQTGESGITVSNERINEGTNRSGVVGGVGTGRGENRGLRSGEEGNAGNVAGHTKGEAAQWFHGSHENIESFKPREVAGVDSIGTWFTGDKAKAGQLYGPNVTRGEVTPRNLLEAHTDNYGDFFYSNKNLFQELFPDKPVSELESWKSQRGKPSPDQVKYLSAFKQMLTDAGYDGVVWKNSRIDLRKSDTPHDVMVSFHQEPIPVSRGGEQLPQVGRPEEGAPPAAPPPVETAKPTVTAADTADEPALSRLANRHTEERAAAGELGQIAPGQGYSKMDLVKQGEKMSPEEVNQHVSDLMQKTGDPIKQASAVSVEEARLSKRSADLSRAAAADPTNVEAKLAADNAFKDLTDFHNGPVARLKEVFHGTGEGLQGEVPVDISTVNGLREAYFKDTGKLPTAAMDKNFESTAARVSKSIEGENGARAKLSSEIEKQAASRKLPSPDEVRNSIRERMGLEPCPT